MMMEAAPKSTWHSLVPTGPYQGQLVYNVIPEDQLPQLSLELPPSGIPSRIGSHLPLVTNLPFAVVKIKTNPDLVRGNFIWVLQKEGAIAGEGAVAIGRLLDHKSASLSRSSAKIFLLQAGVNKAKRTGYGGVGE